MSQQVVSERTTGLGTASCSLRDKLVGYLRGFKVSCTTNELSVERVGGKKKTKALVRNTLRLGGQKYKPAHVPGTSRVSMRVCRRARPPPLVSLHNVAAEICNKGIKMV